jgi:hypothetical protein
MLASRYTTNAVLSRLDCTWSIAHGIRHCSWSLPGKRWGNDGAKDGAACIAGKNYLTNVILGPIPSIPLICHPRVIVLENNDT